MKINLINPPYFDPYSQWDISDLKSSSPPIGLLNLAAVARKLGHEVTIQDFCVDIPDSLIDADLVGITAMTLQIDNAAKIASKYENAHVVLGGSHVTADSLNTMTTYGEVFDSVILGEGEWQFASFLGDSISQNIDDLPFPAFDLVDMKRYRLSPIGSKSKNSIGLVTSRGCYGKCEFCSKAVFGNKIKCHSSSYVIDLLDKLHKDYSCSEFLFYDDLFVGNKPRLIEICEKLAKKKYRWSCCSRVDNLDMKTLKLMKRAGCYMIEYGIESGSDSILKLMNKGITKDKIISSINNTSKSGILSKGNFIFGYLGENHETMKETLSFIKDLKLDYFQHTYMTPLPGTKAWDKAEDYGKFDKDWNKCNTFSINFVPKDLSREDLENYSKKAFKDFYMNPIRIFKELFRGNLLPKIKAFLKKVFK